MKPFIILLLLININIIVKAQSIADEKAVLSLFLKEEKKTAVYSDDAAFPQWLSESINDFLATDTILRLSEQEKADLKIQIVAAKTGRWEKGLVKNLKMINADTLKKIMDDPKLDWPYFEKRYANELCTFSKPIFIRHHTICLFFYSWTEFLGFDPQGSIDIHGDHELWAYVKKGNTWKKKACVFSAIVN